MKSSFRACVFVPASPSRGKFKYARLVGLTVQAVRLPAELVLKNPSNYETMQNITFFVKDILHLKADILLLLQLPIGPTFRYH